MRALTYHGSRDVRIENMPDPIIQKPDDIILKITATAICGSDLHIYRGKIPKMKNGDILGHEFMGIVEEAGSAVTKVKKGDKVVIPFVIACGQCFFCKNRCTVVAKRQIQAKVEILTKKIKPRERPCLAIVICSGVYQEAKQNMFVYLTRTLDRLKSILR